MGAEALLKVFFKNMVQRYQKENDLSDITWCMMNTMRDFGRKFMEFLHISILDDELIEEYQREFIIQDNRIDFFIKTDRKMIFIENKTWDGNYHFEQYDKIIRKEYASKNNNGIIKRLISAHRLAPHYEKTGSDHGFSIYYWDDFVKFLTSKLHEFNSEQIPLVEAYLEYLKEVIKMNEINEIRLDDGVIKSLVYLNRLIEKIINTYKGDGKDFVYTPYKNKNRSFGNEWSGHGYSIQNRSNNKSAWVLFYFQYYNWDNTPNGKPSFLIDIQIDWNYELIDKMKELISQNNNSYKVIFDKEGLAFIMKDEDYELFKTLDKEGQEKHLKDFFINVNKTIEGYLNV